MNFWFLLSLLVVLSRQERLFSAQTQVITQILPNKSIELDQNQEFIYHFENPFVYDIDVYLLEGGKEYLVQDLSVQRNGVVQDDGVYNGRSDCYPLKRQLQVKDILSLTIFDDTNDIYMSDILVVPGQGLALVVTDDFIVNKIKYIYDDDSIVSVSLVPAKNLDLRHTLSNSKDIKSGMAKFAYIKDSMYPVVFTNYGAVLLKLGFDDELEVYAKIESAPARDDIFDVHVINYKIYVAAGHQGIDIYEFDGVTVSFVKNMNIADDDSTIGFNIIDVSSDHTNKYLIALEVDSGLYFFDVEDNSLIFGIHFPGCKAFNHYNNTYIVIAETVNGIEYVAELFINIKKQQYYINRIYIEDTAFYHIEMTPTYAILVSEDSHVVIEHSIYNGFIPKSSEIVTSFLEEDLVKFIHFDQKTNNTKHSNQTTDYYIGLAKGDIKLFEVVHQTPGVVCQFEFDYLHQNNQQTTTIPIQAINECIKLSGAPLHNFSMLKWRGPSLVQTEDSAQYFYSVQSQYNILPDIKISLLVLIFLTVYCYKRWKIEILEMKDKLSEAKKYSQFQEVEVSSIIMKDNEDKNKDNVFA